MFCLGQAVNTVFRYNISQNDLGGVLNLSGNPNGEIYNNVFYMKENVPVNRMSGGKSNIYNNIFYYDGKERLRLLYVTEEEFRQTGAIMFIIIIRAFQKMKMRLRKIRNL